MRVTDERNILRIGQRACAGSIEITRAMVDAVSARIKDAGGVLTVWAVLEEDTYETMFGDGFYLHVEGIALNSDDAQRLADVPPKKHTGTKWYVKSYRLGLVKERPAFLDPWPRSDEFTIGDFVAILSEIGPGETVSKIHYGPGTRKDGPLLELPKWAKAKPGRPTHHGR
ncbi:MAG: hypothetical protein KGL02_06120 [Acidobacteriota bacterium]|nr:hypothetical protein [Acidobacteriota bacterium]